MKPTSSGRTRAVVHLRAVVALPLLLLVMGVSAVSTAAATDRPVCLVLADGHVSEYAWGKYAENTFPYHHPGHDCTIRGLLGYAARFERWLTGWEVRRLDLEAHRGPLPLADVDLVILDDVRQSVGDPYEPALIEHVRAGGGLLVYAGFFGLGGCAKTEYSVGETVASYQHSALGKLLPVAITTTPDWLVVGKRGQGASAATQPAFPSATLGEGLVAPEWQVYALHACTPRGEVLATVGERPLICRGTHGRGHIVVYTGDDLGWLRAAAPSNLNPYAGTLWRRLAAAAIGDRKPIPAVPDPAVDWVKPPAFAHPDQPMNFQWGGAFYYRTPEMERLWARDLVSHSATLYFGAPESLGNAGVQGWESFGCPLATKAAAQDESTWRRDEAGKPVAGIPCFANPRALAYMDAAVAERAATLARSPWVKYGHMGDETEFGNCYCEHCRAAFRAQFGRELPTPTADFSPQFLDRWVDYCTFKNQMIGRMYARASQVAKRANPHLTRMFASLPQSGGMAHGDDQLNTQSGFDLLWDHTYPGTMVIRTGLNAALLEETAVLQGRPQVPVLDLLQGFDSYDRVSHVPPPEYMREMTWQAIAHGVDSIGWFVYNYCWWNLPGSEAWEECGRLAREVLEPLTPTLYEMRNSQEPVGVVWSYSQEAVDGLRELTGDDKDPWKPVIRWWTTHATQEAYEVLKYAHVPLNVVSEYRLMQGGELPYKVLVFPYVEHLHARTRAALTAYMARGGVVYVGANSTLDLPGIRKLPVSFDAKFTTWWPQDKREEWNQRRARQYTISTFLLKAAEIRRTFAPILDEARVCVSDPEVVYNLREAGAAKYLFIINDHQVNPTSPELRSKRPQYNHFMLLPMEFPGVAARVELVGMDGLVYRLFSDEHGPEVLRAGQAFHLDLDLAGGDGQVLAILPDRIARVELTSRPERTAEGVRLGARVLGAKGLLRAALPLRIELRCGVVTQTVYATTKDGVLSWTAPFLQAFPAGPIEVTVTELVGGMVANGKT